MKKFQGLVVCFLLLMLGFLQAQNTTTVSKQGANEFNFQNDSLLSSDSTLNDTLHKSFKDSRVFGLLDTITNDTLLKTVFNPYLSIKQPLFEHSFSKAKRSVPTIKEVKVRPVNHQEWKFWIIVLILIYIAIIRIVNPNNFKMFIFSVFNLKLSEKIWEEQRSFFGFVILQLFAIYIFIAALFVSVLLNIKHISFVDNFFEQFISVSILLFLIYIGKFILHALLGYLLQMKNLGIGMVSNTVSVNNFIALFILPLLIFLIFNNDPVVKIILTQTIIATFFLSIVFRVVRITLLSNSFFNFPKIYLFFYLCALEIFPWFVIIKYLNRFLN
ncbi:MAG: DUF4271 domain-containing protein [Bacteroidota bacterium]